jgi:hypothetical protein
MGRVFALAIILASALHVSAQDVILGALEDVPSDHAGESDSPALRVLFRYDGKNWLAYPSNCHNRNCLTSIVSKFPQHSRWIVAFDGHEVGEVASKTPSEFKFYSQIGLQELGDPSSAPKVGKKSTEFGGDTGAAVYRLLAAISRPYFSDPDGWKVSPVPSDVQSQLRRGFRQRYAKLCKSSATDEAKLELFPYSDDAVAVVKAYRSKSGNWLARLHLANAIDCSDVEAGFEIDDPWFVVRPSSPAKFLDEGMWLVDVGDYDNDGRSELLFSINRDNREGYLLFSDDFNSHVTFEYSYH